MTPPATTSSGWLVRTLTALLVAAAAISGCTDGDAADPETGDTSSGSSPAPEPDPEPGTASAGQCVDDTYTEPAVAVDWTRNFLDVCVTPDRLGVKVVNTSPVVVSVRPTGSTRMDPSLPELGLDMTLADSAGAAYAEVWNSQGYEGTVVAPGQTATATSTSEAAYLEVAVDAYGATAGYALTTVASYVESRLMTGAEKHARSVASCATEIATTWTSAQNLTAANLDALLANTAFGAATSCGSLVRSVAAETGNPPPQAATFKAELKSLGQHMNSTVYDDILKFVRRAVVLG